jgi:hypothetical protein
MCQSHASLATPVHLRAGNVVELFLGHLAVFLVLSGHESGSSALSHEVRLLGVVELVRVRHLV